MFTYLLSRLKSPGKIKRREVSLTLTKSWASICGSRRDQEEGAGPSRELGRDQEQGGGVGLRKLDNLLLQLFLNSCATDIVFVSLLCTAVETAISRVHNLLRTGEVTTALALLFRRGSTASLVFCGSKRADDPLTPPPPSTPFPRP